MPLANSVGPGNLALNYRYQLVGSGETRLAVTPRLTAILPTSDGPDRASGLQGALASSFAARPNLILHSNAGVTVIKASGSSTKSTTVNLGQSLIWLAHERFNVMVEAVADDVTSDNVGVTLSPGFRWAHNFTSMGGLQIVPGVAFPIGFRGNDGRRAVLVYLSFEHELAALK